MTTCFILRLARWKYPERASFVPFAIVGASGIGSTPLFWRFWEDCGNLIGMDLVIVASILLTMCWNFVLDRKLAFWWAREGRAGLQLLGFIAVCAVPVLVNFWITRTFATEDQMATPLAGVIGASIGSALGILFNWGVSRFFVFNR